MDVREKKHLIKKLAKRDPLFDIYKKGSDAAAAAFWDYHNSQPPEVQKILSDYAVNGRMMYLHLFHLACTCLELPPEKAQTHQKITNEKDSAALCRVYKIK